MRKAKLRKQIKKTCSFDNKFHRAVIYYRDGKYWCNKKCWRKGKEAKEAKQ